MNTHIYTHTQTLYVHCLNNSLGSTGSSTLPCALLTLFLFLLITRFFSHPIDSWWWSQRGNALKQTVWSPALWVWYNSVSCDFQKSSLDSECPMSTESLFVWNNESHFPLSFSLFFSLLFCIYWIYIFFYIIPLTLVSSLSFSQRFGGQLKILLVWNVCFLGSISLSFLRFCSCFG